MPTYDYECEACGEITEFFHPMSADPKTQCPLCEEHALKRLIGGGAGFLFKGKGFYITDYRSESYKKQAKKEKEKKDDNSSGGKSEPKQGKGDSPDSGKQSDTSSESKSTEKSD